MIKSSKLKALWANNHFASIVYLLVVGIAITAMVMWPALWLALAVSLGLGSAYFVVYGIVKSVRDGTFLK